MKGAKNVKVSPPGLYGAIGSCLVKENAL